MALRSNRTQCGQVLLQYAPVHRGCKPHAGADAVECPAHFVRRGVMPVEITALGRMKGRVDASGRLPRNGSDGGQDFGITTPLTLDMPHLLPASSRAVVINARPALRVRTSVSSARSAPTINRGATRVRLGNLLYCCLHHRRGPHSVGFRNKVVFSGL